MLQTQINALKINLVSTCFVGNSNGCNISLSKEEFVLMPSEDRGCVDKQYEDEFVLFKCNVSSGFNVSISDLNA